MMTPPSYFLFLDNINNLPIYLIIDPLSPQAHAISVIGRDDTDFMMHGRRIININEDKMVCLCLHEYNTGTVL